MGAVLLGGAHRREPVRSILVSVWGATRGVGVCKAKASLSKAHARRGGVAAGLPWWICTTSGGGMALSIVSASGMAHGP